MPLREYLCKSCQARFETLVSASRTPECPACRSRDLAQQFSIFAVGGRDPELAARGPAGPCGACGDPRGPGACRRD